jgi:hypothetical protein
MEDTDKDELLKDARMLLRDAWHKLRQARDIASDAMSSIDMAATKIGRAEDEDEWKSIL